MDRELELQRLCEADDHIAIAERVISKQMIELEKLRSHGRYTKLAELTLQHCRDALEAMQNHRQNITKMIEQIDQGLA